MHSCRAENGAADLAADIVEPSSDRRTDDVDIAEHHGQAARQTGRCRRCVREPVMRQRAVHDLGHQAGMSCNAKPLAHIRCIASAAEVAIGEDAFGRIDGANAGQLEIEPVFAVQGGRGPLQSLRLMLL